MWITNTNHILHITEPCMDIYDKIVFLDCLGSLGLLWIIYIFRMPTPLIFITWIYKKSCSLYIVGPQTKGVCTTYMALCFYVQIAGGLHCMFVCIWNFISQVLLACSLIGKELIIYSITIGNMNIVSATSQFEHHNSTFHHIQTVKVIDYLII